MTEDDFLALYQQMSANRAASSSCSIRGISASLPSIGIGIMEFRCDFSEFPALKKLLVGVPCAINYIFDAPPSTRGVASIECEVIFK